MDKEPSAMNLEGSSTDLFSIVLDDKENAVFAVGLAFLLCAFADLQEFCPIMGAMKEALLLATLLSRPHVLTPSPLFSTGDSDIASAYAKGFELGHNKKRRMFHEERIRGYNRDLAKIRSGRNRSWTAPYAVLTTPMLIAFDRGIEDARSYRKTDPMTLAADLIPLGGYACFRVRLFAWPGVKSFSGAINRSANIEDVKNVRFALVVDGDADHALLPILDPIPTNLTARTASQDIPETVTGTTSATVTSNGESASGYSSYTIYAQRTQNYDWFYADYTVVFPLSASGQSTISSETKRLELKEIFPGGEHSVSFTLDNLRPLK